MIAAGVCAALHVGKLPPAIDVLRTDFGLDLAEAGLLLSMIQIAGMTAGVLFGAWIDMIGSSRSLRSGLILLALASVGGAFSQTATTMLAWRAVEGTGFLLSVLAAPPWIRTLAAPSRLQRLMGLWGTYMPLGIALGLLVGPLWIAAWSWRGWWIAVGAITAAAAGMTWLVPPDRAMRPAGEARAASGNDGTSPDGGANPTRALAFGPRLLETLGDPGPWLIALCFAVYSSQWLAVVGFLPSMYAQLGITPTTAGMLTAVVSLANAGGNMLGANLLHRGHTATRLIAAGFAVMAIGSFATYADIDGALMGLERGKPLPFELRFAAVLAFSLVGGLIPSSLFALSARMAPSERTLGSTVGWMQQWSAVGQFGGPPLAGWLASVMGGWQFTWLLTTALSAAGLVLAAMTARHLHLRSTTIDARR